MIAIFWAKKAGSIFLEKGVLRERVNGDDHWNNCERVACWLINLSWLFYHDFLLHSKKNCQNIEVWLDNILIFSKNHAPTLWKTSITRNYRNIVSFYIFKLDWPWNILGQPYWKVYLTCSVYLFKRLPQ